MIYQMKIDDIQNADDLRAVFVMNESAELLLSMWFQKPICRLAIQDKECLRSILLDYHCLLKAKAEMDQFAERLKSLWGGGGGGGGKRADGGVGLF